MFRGIHFIPADTKIDFVGQRAITWLVSAFLTVAPLVLVATVGLNMGIDFQGGTLIEQVNLRGVWDFADPAAKREIIRQLREALAELGKEVS